MKTKSIFTFITAILLSFSLLSINAQVVNSNTNVGVGQGVLSSNTTGYRNIGLGDYSLNKNKTGYSNNALGYKALFSNTDGECNVSIGSFSMMSNTIGIRNISIGHKSLYSNTKGYNNIALGYSSMYLNIEGKKNIAIGDRAMYYFTKGNSNTALGRFALYGNAYESPNGSKNNAIGESALHWISSGSENNAIGYKAGFNIQTGIRNNIWGSYANVSTSSNYNIIIGYRTWSHGDNNIIIGKKITLPQGISNAMNIGGVLFGTGFQSALPEGATSTPANGKIGINVVNPTTTLDVAGTGHISSHFYVDGNLGIGTKNPDQKLTVKGKIHAEEVIIDTNVPFPDYVFSHDYNLMPLKEVEQFVKTNNHLPEIPSAGEVAETGLNIGELQTKLLQKIEELTLYAIEQSKDIEELKREVRELKEVKE